MTTLLVMATIIPQDSYADAKTGEALAKKGATGVAPCMQCHGPNGEGQAAAAYPRLAGQNQSYLEKQLLDFKKGRRQGPIMQAMVQPLSPQQMSDVAAYYASLAAWQGVKSASKPPQLHVVFNWLKKAIGIKGYLRVLRVMAIKGRASHQIFRRWQGKTRRIQRSN